MAPQSLRKSLPPEAAALPEPTRPAPPAWQPSVEAPDLSVPPLSTSPLTLAELLDRGALDSKTRPALGGLGVSPATTAVLEALDAAEVDEPVGVLEQPVPRYPSALAGAGITGRVKLAFVVDTAGRAEPGSLRTVFSTHPDFEAAARASVLAGRFRAARLRGAPVPQLVHQTLSFRLEE